MSFPETYAELKVAGAAQGVASNAPGNAGVVGDTISGDILRGHGPRRGGLERLIRYWRPIMKKPGGFRRCVLELADHPELGPDVRPLCAWLHHETTGKWPNEGKKRGRRAAPSARRVLNGPGKSVGFEDLLTEDLVEKLIVVAKFIDPDIETKILEDDIETKKMQPLLGGGHIPGTGAQGRVAGALTPDKLQDEGWKPNPLRSARGSIIHRPLGVRAGIPKIGGAAKRNIRRCPAGFQNGGRFADRSMSNCGERLFALSGGKPGDLIPDVGAPNSARQQKAVSMVLQALAGKDSGPYLIRADGIILRPLMSPGRLGAFKATKDTEGAIYIGKGEALESLGREEVRLLTLGVQSVIMVTKKGDEVRITRKGSLSPAFGRQVGALTRSATAGSNPMKRVASTISGLIYAEKLRGAKALSNQIETKADSADMDGCMVAIRVPNELNEKLKVDGGEDVSNMHITLAYLGKAVDVDFEGLKKVVETWASGWDKLKGKIAGYGLFMNPGTDVLYAAPDIHGLDALRSDLVEHLEARGFSVASDHGFTPHLTLKYADPGTISLPDSRPPSDVFDVDSVHVVRGTEWHDYPLRTQ